MKPSAEELFGPAGTPRVVVVGAGFGGIAAGVKLKRAGIHTFTIYESSLGSAARGGTTPTRAPRSTSARTSTRSRSSRTTGPAPTPSRPSCRSTSRRRSTSSGCGRTCGSASPWSRRRGTTTATSGRSASTTAPPTSATCSSAGSASSTCPATPTGPGSTTSTGPKFHTARWEHQHDLTGKVVAVVGTGSTATQIVPAIQPIVRAALRVPARAGLGHAQGRARLHRRGARDVRQAVAAQAGALAAEVAAGEEHLGRQASSGPAPRRTRPATQFCLDYIAREFDDRPDLREAVTPTYPYPGKRPIFAQHLLPRAQGAQRRAGPRGGRVGDAAPGIVDVDGVERAGRRPRDGDRVPARELPRPPATSSAATAARCRSTGPASRTPSSASPCPSSPTSSCSTGRAPTAARSSPCSRARRSTRCGR